MSIDKILLVRKSKGSTLRLSLEAYNSLLSAADKPQILNCTYPKGGSILELDKGECACLPIGVFCNRISVED